MNNEMFLKQYQNLYESLRYFSLNDNKLILNYEGTYTLPIFNINLSKINPNLFILKPTEIFHILRALELLYKKELNDNDIDFLTQYVTTYLLLNDKSLEGSEKYINEVNGFKIPIYLSYDPYFINNPSSVIIQNLINQHNNEIETGKSKHPKLVLENSNFKNKPYEDEIFLSQAGFSTLLLIFLTVAATCLFIYQFILKN